MVEKYNIYCIKTCRVLKLSILNGPSLMLIFTLSVFSVKTYKLFNFTLTNYTDLILWMYECLRSLTREIN